jgi:hypothetical protein
MGSGSVRLLVKMPDLRLLHKGFAGVSVGRVRQVLGGGLCLGEALVLEMLGAPVLGGRRGRGCAPEFEQVVGGGDQLPLGLAGS